jgi:2-phospho-L-lactate guanylyltransferase
MILVPVKNLDKAKQRLAVMLDQPARTELARAMLADVLYTIANWLERPEVSLITSDPFALELSRELGFSSIVDAENLGETQAIAKATEFCERRGAASTCVFPGDIPLISVAELKQIFSVAPKKGSVLVPASDGRGTNAVLRSPAGLFPLRFGNDSFQPHLVTAQATGFPCRVLPLPGIGLDVDNPDDLFRLASADGETRSQLLLRRWGFANLPIAANE